MLTIRLAKNEDFDFIWPIFHSVVSKGETYVYHPDTSVDQAFSIWIERPLQTYVVEIKQEIVATYYIKSNYTGLGRHVCSCGYMVKEDFRNQGIAFEMSKHSMDAARKLGFKAMQFNFVVSTNTASIRLWKKMGFEIVGTVPKAFNHSVNGLVDVHIMHQSLV